MIFLTMWLTVASAQTPQDMPVQDAASTYAPVAERQEVAALVAPNDGPDDELEVCIDGQCESEQD